MVFSLVSTLWTTMCLAEKENQLLGIKSSLCIKIEMLEPIEALLTNIFDKTLEFFLLSSTLITKNSSLKMNTWGMWV